MFACRNLNLSYKGNKILKDIHFHIPEGTVFCITGESGSGKSSLLKVINGIIPEITEAEISGEIKLNDMRLNEMDIAQRSRYISTVYQNPKTQFYCVESTDELAFPLENRNLPKDEMVKIIKKYTELLDTEKLLNRNIFSLSGGEKQLMAITSVMTMDNQVYLFDEPSASLDHHSIGLLKKCIAELKRKGKIVIIAEHRLYYLKEIMDYLAVLKEGKLEMISVEDLDHDKICRLIQSVMITSTTLEEGTLTIKVANEKTVTTEITVDKKWFRADGTEFHPQDGEISYNLIQVLTTEGGESSEKIYKSGETLTSQDGWQKTYSNLPAADINGNGEKEICTYYVKEILIADYSTSYSNGSVGESEDPSAAALSSGTITVKNTEKMKFILPETGGTGRGILYIAGVFLLGISMILLGNKNSSFYECLHKKG